MDTIVLFPLLYFPTFPYFQRISLSLSLSLSKRVFTSQTLCRFTLQFHVKSEKKIPQRDQIRHGVFGFRVHVLRLSCLVQFISFPKTLEKIYQRKVVLYQFSIASSLIFSSNRMDDPCEELDSNLYLLCFVSIKLILYIKVFVRTNPCRCMCCYILLCILVFYLQAYFCSGMSSVSSLSLQLLMNEE